MKILELILAFLTLSLLRGTLSPSKGSLSKGLRRRLYLAALKFRPLGEPPPAVQFVNIGEGSHEDGQITLIPAATTASRYLLYSKTAGTNGCSQTAANAAPLGSSDDYPDNASYLTQGIGVKIFGVFHGTVRIVTDGTLQDGSYVKVGANGQGTVWTSGADSGNNYCIGQALITADQSANAGDVVELVHRFPGKYV